LLAAVPASAKPHAAKFKLTVSGVQDSSWSRDEFTETDSDLHCGIHTLRNGSERNAFATSKPLAVRAIPYRYGSFTVPKFSFGKRKAGFPVQATVVRAETDNSKDTCTGDPYPPYPPLDCGTKHVRWDLALASDYRRSGGVWIGLDPVLRPPDKELFQGCEQTLFEWPMIQDHDPNGNRTWAGAVPNRRFFNKRAKRIVVHADWATKGDPQDTGLTSSAVHLSWKLVFKRVSH
jgi:hypothetical protein